LPWRAPRRDADRSKRRAALKLARRCCSVAAVGCVRRLAVEIELEIVEVIDTPQATHIRYRVRP
jgi:hypothetical protein